MIIHFHHGRTVSVEQTIHDWCKHGESHDRLLALLGVVRDARNAERT